MVVDKFGMEWDDVVPQERLIYGDYMIPGAEPTVYEEISDLEKLTVRYAASNRGRRPTCCFVHADTLSILPSSLCLKWWKGERETMTFREAGYRGF